MAALLANGLSARAARGPSARPRPASACRGRLSVHAIQLFGAKKAPETEGVLDCVVVGAGVSGLCIAQALETKHAGSAPRLLVTEARERVGGNITTVSVRGFLPTFQDCVLRRSRLSTPQLSPSPAARLAERRGLPVGGGTEQLPGARSPRARARFLPPKLISSPLQPSQPILRAAVDAGLKEELVFGDPTAPRFVWWEGKLRPVPAGLPVRTAAAPHLRPRSSPCCSGPARVRLAVLPWQDSRGPGRAGPAPRPAAAGGERGAVRATQPGALAPPPPSCASLTRCGTGR